MKNPAIKAYLHPTMDNMVTPEGWTYGPQARPLVLLADFEALAAQLEGLRKDAERYRWLKTQPTWLGWDSDFRPDEIEREIDASMPSTSRSIEITP